MVAWVTHCIQVRHVNRVWVVEVDFIGKGEFYLFRGVLPVEAILYIP